MVCPRSVGNVIPCAAGSALCPGRTETSDVTRSPAPLTDRLPAVHVSRGGGRHFSRWLPRETAGRRIAGAMFSQTGRQRRFFTHLPPPPADPRSGQSGCIWQTGPFSAGSSSDDRTYPLLPLLHPPDRRRESCGLYFRNGAHEPGNDRSLPSRPNHYIPARQCCGMIRGICTCLT